MLQSLVAALAVMLSLSSCALINRPVRSYPKSSRPVAAHVRGEGQFWESPDGTVFPKLVQLPPRGQKTRGIVIFADGWDSSTEDYRPLARWLARGGYSVAACEIRGQKYDPVFWRRGLPGSYRAWVEDFKAFCQSARSSYDPGTPWFIHGHSFGGLVGLAAVAEMAPADKPRGMIVHSPGYPFVVAKDSRLRNVLLAPFFWVRLPHLLASDLMQTLPTGDLEHDGRWLRSPDRLRRGYTLKFFAEAIKLGHAAHASLPYVGVPLLALEGGQDRVNTSGGFLKREDYTAFMRDEVGRPPNEYRAYPHEGHTVFIGPEGTQAFGDMFRWIERHR
jgi:alpha-beta hydrolase superfamily lysophospholipase